MIPYIKKIPWTETYRLKLIVIKSVGKTLKKSRMIAKKQTQDKLVKKISVKITHNSPKKIRRMNITTQIKKEAKSLN